MKMKMDKKQALIDDLSKMSPIVLSTAYLYATNLTRYGVDVTEKWTTAVDNTYALQRAYLKGYDDALHEVSSNG